jgi:hypothetical protein
VILREGEHCTNLYVVRDGYCLSTRLTQVPYTATDSLGNPVSLPMRKAGAPAPVTLQSLRPSVHHSRLKFHAKAVSKISSIGAKAMGAGPSPDKPRPTPTPIVDDLRAKRDDGACFPSFVCPNVRNCNCYGHCSA